MISRSFPPEVHEQIGYYVYRLIDPRNDETFYVGKGVGDRVFQHLGEALDGDRDTLKLERIRDINRKGETVQYIIHMHGLTEKEAFEVEAALIDAYGLARDALSVLTNVQGGYHGVRGAMSCDDVIALYAAEKADFELPTLVLKLSRQFERALSPEELYERTRGTWKVNPYAHLKVHHAMPVSAGGVIREVYRITRWTQIDVTDAEESPLRRQGIDVPSRTRLRWMFDGEVDLEVRADYVGKCVPAARQAQSPVLWLDGAAEAVGPRPTIVPATTGARSPGST